MNTRVFCADNASGEEFVVCGDSYKEVYELAHKHYLEPQPITELDDSDFAKCLDTDDCPVVTKETPVIGKFIDLTAGEYDALWTVREIIEGLSLNASKFVYSATGNSYPEEELIRTLETLDDLLGGKIRER